MHSVGPAIIEAWVDHPNVTALVWAGIAGQEAGNSIVDVLYGAYNPSGRLPYTIAKAVSDYGAQPVLGGSSAAVLSIPYTEGLNIDYRHFDSVSTLRLGPASRTRADCAYLCARLTSSPASSSVSD